MQDSRNFCNASWHISRSESGWEQIEGYLRGIWYPAFSVGRKIVIILIYYLPLTYNYTLPNWLGRKRKETEDS